MGHGFRHSALRPMLQLLEIGGSCVTRYKKDLRDPFKILTKIKQSQVFLYLDNPFSKAVLRLKQYFQP